MPTRKCDLCRRPAIAYRLEGDGTRTYLCDQHIPTDEEGEIRKTMVQAAPDNQALRRTVP